MMTPDFGILFGVVACGWRRYMVDISKYTQCTMHSGAHAARAINALEIYAGIFKTRTPNMHIHVLCSVNN